MTEGKLSREMSRKKSAQNRKKNPDALIIWEAKNASKYECLSCEYKTHSKNHFTFHLATKKHRQEWDEYLFDVEMDRMADISIFD
jgi:Zn ribbon nucleic-acid-binding protein